MNIEFGRRPLEFYDHRQTFSDLYRVSKQLSEFLTRPSVSIVDLGCRTGWALFERFM